MGFFFNIILIRKHQALLWGESFHNSLGVLDICYEDNNNYILVMGKTHKLWILNFTEYSRADQVK